MPEIHSGSFLSLGRLTLITDKGLEVLPHPDKLCHQPSHLPLALLRALTSLLKITCPLLRGLHPSSFPSKMVFNKVLVAQSCLTHGLSGSSVHGILQERVLEWVAIPFSRGSS